MSRLGAYQMAARHYGTSIVRASKGVPPRIGGGITKHPLALAVAEALTTDLRALGAEARICSPREQDQQALVYLSGCSFQKGDLTADVGDAS